MYNLFSAIDVSSTALEAQRMRINILSSNLANINSTRTEEGGPYRRKSPVFSSDNVADNFEDVLDNRVREGIKKVRVADIVVDDKPPKMVYDPKHPDANDQGFVALPNINMMEELVNIMSASRSYEANVTALNSTKSMLLKALQIGQA